MERVISPPRQGGCGQLTWTGDLIGHPRPVSSGKECYLGSGGKVCPPLLRTGLDTTSAATPGGATTKSDQARMGGGPGVQTLTGGALQTLFGGDVRIGTPQAMPRLT